MWRCHQLLSGFLAKDHLPRVSRQSRLSTNGKGDNEMIPAADKGKLKKRRIIRILGIIVIMEDKN